MKRKIFSILFAVVLAVSLMLVPAVVSANPSGCVLWGVDSAREVFTVDTTTGTVTIVHSGVGNPLYGDIAMTPDGKLYATGADPSQPLTTIAPNGWAVLNFNDFYRLNPANGAIVTSWLDAFTSAGFERVNALCAESNTTLLAIEGGGVGIGWGYPTGPRLLRITLDAAGNLSSITNLGPIAAPTATSCLSDGDLDKDPFSGKWYAGFWAGAGSEMLELNLTNPGASTLISQSNIQWQGGFAFCPDGTAYAGCWADMNLYTVNVLAGGSTLAYDLSAALAGNIYGLSSTYPVTVGIDIKPGSDPNSINPNSKGVIPVAILGSATFDVTTVDVTTLDFEGASPAHDLTDPLVYADHLQDVNGDGYMDLVSHYRTQDTGITKGYASATLTGFTNTGWPITGSDSVRTVGK